MSQYPNDIHPDYPVATAYTKDNTAFDYIGNWQTAQQMANDGYRIVVHQGDGSISKDELQRLVDTELANAVDCFGPGYQK